MDLHDIYNEEDLFPKIFSNYEERSYGVLFYNEDNKDSFDSNHAVIYRDRIDDLKKVLSDLIHFYETKGIRPMIYQSILDDGWFDEIKDELTKAGFTNWIESQELMIPKGENKIIINHDIEIVKISRWSDEIENVFLEAEEPWEIKVAKKSLEHPQSWMFGACDNGRIIGLLYGHLSGLVCRLDYLLVSKKHRNKGAARALFNAYVEWSNQNGINCTFLWPDGETPKRIYEEGGFEVVENRKAGRAIYGELEY